MACAACNDVTNLVDPKIYLSMCMLKDIILLRTAGLGNRMQALSFMLYTYSYPRFMTVDDLASCQTLLLSMLCSQVASPLSTYLYIKLIAWPRFTA